MPPSLPPTYKYPCERGYDCPYKSVACHRIPRGRTCIAIRRGVRIRDRVCIVCGSKSKLSLHHIQPSSVKPEHLTTLCRSCHTKLHQQKLSVIVDTFNMKFIITELLKNGVVIREHEIKPYELPSYEDDEQYILNRKSSLEKK